MLISISVLTSKNINPELATYLKQVIKNAKFLNLYISKSGSADCDKIICHITLRFFCIDLFPLSIKISLAKNYGLLNPNRPTFF